MTNEEKLVWLQNYLHNCLGEELPAIQDIYTFGSHKIADDEVLENTPEIILHGRIVRTIKLDSILNTCTNVETLTKESFAVVCTNDPLLNGWYLWNVDRGMIEV